jgi:hypothetical protein
MSESKPRARLIGMQNDGNIAPLNVIDSAAERLLVHWATEHSMEELMTGLVESPTVRRRATSRSIDDHPGKREGAAVGRFREHQWARGEAMGMGRAQVNLPRGGMACRPWCRGYR